MPATREYQDQILAPRFGMYVQGYADRYPELTKGLLRIYRTKIAGIPWIPTNWLPTVEALHGRESQLLVPVSSKSNPIAFLSTPEQEAWWDAFSAEAHKVMAAYAAGDAAKGAYELRKLEFNSRMYDGAYQLARILAAPITVPLAAANAAIKNPITASLLLWGGVAVVAGFLLWRRSSRR